MSAGTNRQPTSRSASTPAVTNGKAPETPPPVIPRSTSPTTVVSSAPSDPNDSLFFVSNAPGCTTCATFIGDYNGLAVDIVPLVPSSKCDANWTGITRLALWAEPLPNERLEDATDHFFQSALPDGS